MSRPWILVLAFVAVRLLVLVASPLSEHNIDELYTGVIIRDLSQGPSFPLLDYQYEDYGGGSLILAILGVPLFALLGPRYVALKLLALGWSAAGFTIWLRLFDRTLGRQAMAAAGWMWVFAPMLVLKLNLVAWGNHSESTLFTGLALLLFLEARGLTAARGPGECARVTGAGAGWGRLLACGVVSGLSVYFCYSSLAGVAALGLLWCLVDRRLPPRRGVFPFVLGAAAGFSPWLLYNLPRGLSGLAIQSRRLDTRVLGIRGMLGKCYRLFRVDLPGMLAPPAALGVLRPLGTVVLVLLVVLGATAVVIVAVRTWRAGPGRGLPAVVVFLLHLPVFAVAYSMTDLGTSPERFGVYAYRYLAPVFPFFAGLFGAGVLLWPALRLGAAVPAGVTAAAIAMTLATEPFGDLHWTSYSGYSYRRLGLRLGGAYPDLGRLLAGASRIAHPRDRRYCREGILTGHLRMDVGGPYAPSTLPLATLLRARERLGSLDPELAPLAERALDIELRFRTLTRELEEVAPDRWLATCSRDRGCDLASRTDAVTLAVCVHGEEGPARAAALVRDLPLEERPAGWGALGACAAHRSGPGGEAEAAANLATALDPDGAGRGALYRGLGAAIGLDVEGPDRQALRLDRIPARFRGDFIRGIAGRLREGDAEDPVLVEDRVRRLLRVAGMAGMAEITEAPRGAPSAP